MKDVLLGMLLGAALVGPGVFVVLAEQQGNNQFVLGVAVTSVGLLGAWLAAVTEHRNKPRPERKGWPFSEKE